MAKSEFSETQFAFAFFHHLVKSLPKNLRFKFPTLKQEGDYKGEFGGADLIINSNVFIQFKTSDYFIYANTTETNNNSISRKFLPYYRFNIKNSPNSFQYNKLKKTSRNKNNFVCYVAPIFHTIREFFKYYDSNFLQNIIYYNLKDFKNIEIDKNNKHTICFQKSGESYICSEPIKIQSNKIIESFVPLEFMESNDIGSTYSEVVSQIFEVFTIPENLRNNINDIQNYLIISNNVFWIPIIRYSQVNEKRS